MQSSKTGMGARMSLSCGLLFPFLCVEQAWLNIVFKFLYFMLSEGKRNTYALLGNACHLLIIYINEGGIFCILRLRTKRGYFMSARGYAASYSTAFMILRRCYWFMNVL